MVSPTWCVCATPVQKLAADWCIHKMHSFFTNFFCLHTSHKRKETGALFCCLLCASGLGVLQITLAAWAHEKRNVVISCVETMHHTDVSAKEFLVHLAWVPSEVMHLLTLNSSYGHPETAIPSAALSFVCWLIKQYRQMNNLIS